MTSISNKHQAIMLFLLLISAVLLYSNTLRAPFYLDDAPNIFQNPHIRLTELSFKKLVQAGFESHSSQRPIANISFALNYYFNRYNVIGYHVVNIMIHIVNGILLYFFTKTTLNIPSLRARYKPCSSIAFFTALIWLVHPIQIQSVTYVVQRMNSMCALFFTLSLLLYMKGRLVAENQKRWPWFAGCAFTWILALGSKQIAATLPFFVLLYEWYFFQNRSMSWLKHKLPYVIGVCIFLGIIVFAYAGLNPVHSILSGYASRDFTLTERVLTQFRVVAYYVSLLVYPHPGRLNLLHDFEVSHSLIDPISTLISMGVIVGSIGLAFCLAKKEPLISFSILWFFGNLVMESSVISLEMIFEHRTYLPSMLMWLIVVVLIHKFATRKSLAFGLLGIIAFTFSLWTYERNSVWASETSFWNDCAKKTSGNPRVFHGLGRLHLKKRNIDEALEAFETALTIDPDFVISYVGLGAALRAKGRIADAISVHKKAIKMAPDYDLAYYEAYHHLGADYLAQHKLDMAIETLHKAIKLNSSAHEPYNSLGLAYAKKGNGHKALEMYQQAIAIRPDFSLAYNNLGALYLEDETDKAILFLRRAIELDPSSADAHSNLGLAVIKKGSFSNGISQFKRALQLEPDHQDATFNLARAYELQGEYEKAAAQYDRSIRLNPKDVQAYHNSGIVSLYHLGDEKRAMHYFKKALSVDPQYPESERAKKIMAELAETQ
jgi:tetratricopeptide (TPR) repeat protein